MAKVDSKTLDKIFSELDSEIREDLDILISWQDECEYDWRNDDLYDSHYNGDN